MRSFIDYYLTTGGKLATEVGFVALPDAASQLALRHFNENRLGTVFGGVPEVGVTIDDLMQRQKPKL